MKKKILIGAALLMVMSLLVGCGGVSQEDLDAALADLEDCDEALDVCQDARDATMDQLNDAEIGLAAAESDLAAAQDDLADALDDLADAEEDIAALEEDLAACEAGGDGDNVTDGDGDGEEIVLLPLSFDAATYTNTDYGFSLQHPDYWEENTADPAEGVIWRFGDAATYGMPAVRLIVRDEADGATLEEVFGVVLDSDGKAIDDFEASDVIINGTPASMGVVVYPHSMYGDYDSVVIGLIKDGQWIIIEAYTLPGLGALWLTDTMQDEIISTITFD